MIVADLPSGYLLARALRHRRGPVMVAALIGSGLQDFDILWFHFVDQTVHHHRFWPHTPAVWLVISVIALPLVWCVRKDWFVVSLAVLAGVWLHLILDTWAGDILWLWPFSDRFFSLFTVPATQSFWGLSFVLDWTFLGEIAIILAAILVYFTPERPQPNDPH